MSGLFPDGRAEDIWLQEQFELDVAEYESYQRECEPVFYWDDEAT